MQPGPITTTPSGGIPAGLRKKITLDAAPSGHAAGILFVAPDGDVLVLRRSSTEENYAGHWALPGGKADEGETPEQAARREAVEETGNEMFLESGPLKAIDGRITPNGMAFHTFAQPVVEKFVPKLNDEHSGYAWAPLNMLPQPLHPAVQKTLEERLGVAKDMTPEDWKGLTGGLMKFLSEEAAEPEHAEDAGGDFSEGDHPRAPDGKFGSGGGGSGGGEPSDNEKKKIADIAAKHPSQRSDEEKRSFAMHMMSNRATNAERMAESNKSAEAMKEAMKKAGGGGGKFGSGAAGGGAASRIGKSGRAYTDAELKKDYRTTRSGGKESKGHWHPDVGHFTMDEDAGIDAALEKLISKFKTENGRDPDDDERKAIYADAQQQGAPGLDAKAWSEWCRGQEEKLKSSAADAGGALARDADSIVTDSAISLALDEDSVREFDRDGRMRVAVTNISKACVSPYLGHEIPGWQQLGLDPNKIYPLLRDPDELKKGAASSNGVQLLQKHVPVSAADAQQWDVVGTTGTDAEFVEPYLRNSLFVWTKNAISGIETDGKKELSMGYHYRPDMTPGEFDGTPYAGVMRDIVVNHVALVKDGRAGPDVVVGDSKELILMTKPTRLANVALQLTARAIKPILARDAKIDLMPIFREINSKNFKAKNVRMALDEALKDKIVKDGDMGPAIAVLEAIEGLTDEKGADESVSEEQHKAMEAAAGGESKLGIPEKVGKEFVDKDKDKPSFDAEPVKAFMKEKGMADDDIDAVMDMMFKKTGADAFPEDLNKDKDKKPAVDEDKMKDMVSKPAMDAAISAATAATAKQVRETERGIRVALHEVKPYVGELPETIAFDSAEGVYRHVLGMLGRADAKTLHADALKPVLEAQPKPGAKPAQTGAPVLGMDAANVQRITSKFPGIELIGAA